MLKKMNLENSKNEYKTNRKYVKVRTIIAAVGFTVAITNIGIEAFVDDI